MDPADYFGYESRMAEGNAPLLVGIGEILWDLLPGGKQLGGAPANFAYQAVPSEIACLGSIIGR
jgi:hypothetical protein